MKQKIISFTTLIILFNFAHAQKLPRLLLVGGEADVPISNKIDFDAGFGGNLSYVSPGKKEGGAIFSVSLLSYQFSFNNSPGNTKTHTSLFKLQAGAVSKLTKNLYLISQAGVAVANETVYKNGISPIITVGPSLLLPVSHDRVRIGAALSYSNGLMGTFNAAYGLHL